MFYKRDSGPSTTRPRSDEGAIVSKTFCKLVNKSVPGHHSPALSRNPLLQYSPLLQLHCFTSFCCFVSGSLTTSISVLVTSLFLFFMPAPRVISQPRLTSVGVLGRSG